MSEYKRVQFTPVGESKTIQSDAAACDINRMMRKYQQTGQLEGVPDGKLFYGDFSDVDDFMMAQESIRNAGLAFAALPAEIRARFQNSPAQLLAFFDQIDQPGNALEAHDLGLIKLSSERLASLRPTKEEAKAPEGTVEPKEPATTGGNPPTP